MVHPECPSGIDCLRTAAAVLIQGGRRFGKAFRIVADYGFAAVFSPSWGNTLEFPEIHWPDRETPSTYGLVLRFGGCWSTYLPAKISSAGTV